MRTGQQQQEQARSRAGLSGTILGVVLTTGCFSKQPQDAPSSLHAQILVQDEQGQALPGARVSFDPDREDLSSAIADERGRAIFQNLPGPQMAVVQADGYLSRPLAIEWAAGDSPQQVKLRPNPGGKKITMNFGGDAMFGRRYELPTQGHPKIPQHDPASGAKQVVRHLKHAFSSANFRVLNLETVIGNLSESSAYPGKRFLLIARPESLAALQSLGVDLVTLANNHSRDWLDGGVTTTIQALNQYAVPFVGAGMTQQQAEAPVVLSLNGTRIAVFSYTTVTGSFVNNKYPGDDAVAPPDASSKERWMYEPREWGFESPEWTVPSSPRSIGGAWRLFKAQEPELSEETLAKAWASLDRVYPELQDWVARRGHGGAAMWRTKAATELIQQTRPNADVIIVQLHAGFQFQSAASTSVKARARSAIDAGADLVVAHHPHVLQGLEWYKGKLIAYSLGNFIFDQDFLSTFPSGFLHTVWDSATLSEARFIPTMLIGYEPTPVTDHSAQKILREVWAKSRLPAVSLRDKDGEVKVVLQEPNPAQGTPADLIFEQGSGKITQGLASASVSRVIEADTTLHVSSRVLVQGNLGQRPGANPSLLVGRDLFRWGSFEDEMADDSTTGNLHWHLNPKNAEISWLDPKYGQRFLRVRKWAGSDSAIMIRPVARVPLLLTRFWRERDEQLVSADAPASYSIQLSVRTSKKTPLSLAIDVYHFDDTNPTQDPESNKLGRLKIPFISDPGQWQDFDLQFELRGLGTAKKPANMLMPYIAIGAPESGTSKVDIDEFRVMEWRACGLLPDFFDAYDQVKNRASSALPLNFQFLPGDPSIQDPFR